MDDSSSTKRAICPLIAGKKFIDLRQAIAPLGRLAQQTDDLDATLLANLFALVDSLSGGLDLGRLFMEPAADLLDPFGGLGNGLFAACDFGPQSLDAFVEPLQFLIGPRLRA